MTADGDLEFYLTNQETAEAVRAMSRRIMDKKHPTYRLIINMRKIPSKWEPLNKVVKDAIKVDFYS